MRGMFLASALAVLVTIAWSPARASNHTPVSGEPVDADRPSQPVALWPPSHPEGARGLQFRGTRPPFWKSRFKAAAGRVAGRYFINADSSDRVIVTIVDADRVRLESPGEWEGAGILADTTYWGVFVYRDDAREARNRGARGTHLGTLEPSGRLLIRGTFTNRAWPEFESSWMPLDPPVATLDPETLVDLPVTDLFEHPLWTPERGRASGPEFERPLWPPEWFRGDQRIMLADEANVDVLPEVTRRVEPDLEDGGRDRSVAAGGLVVVRALVDPDGSVIDVCIARSVPALDDAALRAVRQWRFRPARRNGVAIRTPVYLPVQFAPR